MNATLARLHRLTRPAGAPADGALLDAFLAGDQSAFALLVSRHAGLVLATCRRVLRHQQDAEDAFQATFLVLARRAADVWPRAAVGSWLFGVAHRCALNARTARVRRAARQEALTDVPAPERPPTEPDTVELVQRAVSALPDVYRAAVVACDLQGLSRKEAAEHLGWSEGTLSGRLARARALLAARLARRGVRLSAGVASAVLVAGDAAPAALLRSAAAFATAGPVPAPVAALTEGVVRGMWLFKFKVTMAAVLVVLGFGAVAALGGGPGEQPGPNVPTVSNPLAKPGQEARSDRAERLATDTSKPIPTVPEQLATPLDATSRPPDPSGRAPGQPAKQPSPLDPFQGKWSLVSLSESDRVTRAGSTEWRLPPAKDWVLTVSGGDLWMPYQQEGQWLNRGYKVVAEFAVQKPDAIPHRNTIDMIRPGEPVGRGIYEFTAPPVTCMRCHVQAGVKTNGAGEALCTPGLKAMPPERLRLAFSIDGKRPTKFGGEGVLVFDLKRHEEPSSHATPASLNHAIRGYTNARDAVELAQQDYHMAQAQFAKACEALDLANQQLKLAQAQFNEAERAGNRAPPRAGPTFAVHVRPLIAPERVIHIAAGGRDTVLEALVYAADDVPLKSDAVSVWVVRDKVLFPVDLVAITKGGDAKTNYVLKAGDQLFVQVKPAR